MGPFALISDGGELPVFAFRVTQGADDFSVYDVSEAMRVRGWILPAYRMPPAIEDVAVLRVCVRNGFSRDLASMLLDDLGIATKRVAGRSLRAPADEPRTSFHH